MSDEDQLIEIDEHILQNSDGSLNTLESYEQKKEKDEVQCDYIHLAVPLLLYSIIHILLKQQQTVLLILIMHTLFSVVIMITGIINSENTITRLRFMLKNGQENYLFWSVTILDILCNFVIYYISYKAYIHKKYKMYENLSRWVFVSFFIQVLLFLFKLMQLWHLSKYLLKCMQRQQHNQSKEQFHYLNKFDKYIINQKMSDIGVKIIRALNAVSAVVIAFAGLWISITLIVHGSLSVSAYCGPLFFILFGFLLVANELGYPKLLDEFGFLKTFLGRGLFYIFLAGIVCYAYAMINNSFVAADIYGSIFFGLGVIYLLMNFYPKGQLGNMSRSLQID